MFQTEGTTSAEVLRQVKECSTYLRNSQRPCGESKKQVRAEVKEAIAMGDQMLQGIENHFEGFSFTLREMENLWKLSQRKS